MSNPTRPVAERTDPNGNLPARYGDTHQTTPAQRLALAVIERAIEDLAGPVPEHAADAAEWLAGTREGERMTLDTCCHMQGWESDAIRERAARRC